MKEKTTMQHPDAFEAAKEVAWDLRGYIRDRFTPGSLESLNEVEREITAKVYAAIVKNRVEDRHA